MGKVETVVDGLTRRLMKRLKRGANVSEDDPIYKTAEKQIKFALQMSEGKRRAKARRQAEIPPLFK